MRKATIRTSVRLRLFVMLLLVAACQSQPANVAEPTTTFTPIPTNSPTPVIEMPATIAPSATILPTATAHSVAVVEAEPTATDTVAVTEPDFSCPVAGVELARFRDEARGIAFCYPAGWQVIDNVAQTGFYLVAPAGRASFGDSQVILVYPDETVADLVEPLTGTTEPLYLAAQFFQQIVRDAELDGELEIVEEGSLTRTYQQLQGTVEGELISGSISGITAPNMSAMAITYVYDPELSLELARHVMMTIQLDSITFAVNDNAPMIALNQAHEGQLQAEEPNELQFMAEAGQFLLIVAEATVTTDVELYDPAGQQLTRFNTAFLTGWGSRDGTTNKPFGYVEPDGLLIAVETSGVFGLTLAEDPRGGTVGGQFRLTVYDVSDGSDYLQSHAVFPIEAEETQEHLFAAQADQPLLLYVELLEGDPDITLLSYNEDDYLLSAVPLEQRFSTRILQWLPRSDGFVRFDVRHNDGGPAAYRLALVADPTAGRAHQAPTYPAFVDQYALELLIGDDGLVEVTETMTVTANVAMTEFSWRWPDFTPAEINDLNLSYESMSCQPTLSDAGDACRLEVDDGGTLVTWSIELDPGSLATIQIGYNVIGRGSLDAPSFAWPIFWAEREFGVGLLSVTMDFANERLIANPQIIGAQGVAITDGSISTRDKIVTYIEFRVDRDIRPGMPLLISVEFEG